MGKGISGLALDSLGAIQVPVQVLFDRKFVQNVGPWE
jgi:hypothetical protein